MSTTEDEKPQPFGMRIDASRYTNISVDEAWPLPRMNASAPGGDGMIFGPWGRMRMQDGVLVPIDDQPATDREP